MKNPQPVILSKVGMITGISVRVELGLSNPIQLGPDDRITFEWDTYQEGFTFADRLRSVADLIDAWCGKR